MVIPKSRMSTKEVKEKRGRFQPIAVEVVGGDHVAADGSVDVIVVEIVVLVKSDNKERARREFVVSAREESRQVLSSIRYGRAITKERTLISREKAYA